MIRLRSKRFSRSNSSKLGGGVDSGVSPAAAATIAGKQIKWELRPGGMLVQKRETQENAAEDEMMIVVKVSTVSNCHHISVQATSTFGELKILLSILTKLEPHEQRLLFKGKEREDDEHLHMVGVRDGDKVLMLEDPAIKESKLLGSTQTRVIGSLYRTIIV